MYAEVRKSGIGVLGEIPWGTHFCQFYEKKEDLLELLIPYFKTGLENNEYCLWICDPLTQNEAYNALKEVIPYFEIYTERKSIEILSHEDWHTRLVKFDAKSINAVWLQKLDDALRRGYDGMRVNRNEPSHDKNHWHDFMEHEHELNGLVRERRMIVLCTYPFSQFNGETSLDVAHAHECIISRRKGHWQMLEEPELKKKKADLINENKELDIRVAERTNELEKVIGQLKKEIEERQKAEEQLRHEKDLSNEIIDSIPGLFALFDENLRFVRWNKSFETASGYTPAEISKLHGIESFYDHEKDKKRTSMILKEMIEKGNGSAEVNPLMKDGNPITLFFIGRSFKYKGQTHLITTGIDVTELRKAETQLIREKELSKQILDSIPGIVTVFNENREYTHWNKNFERLLEKTGKKLPLYFEDWHPDENQRQYARELFDTMFSGKLTDLDATISLVTGEPRTLHITGRAIEFEGKPCLLCISMDITERKKAEEELNLAYQRLSYHLKNTPLAVIEWDKDLNITGWSGQAEKIFGWTASEALGKNMLATDFLLVYEEDRPKVDKVAYELMNGQVDRNVSVNRNNTKDRKVIYCEWYNSALRDEAGNVITILSLTHDVTEEKEAEVKLNESYQQIRSLTEHLQNIREEERTRISREIHDELGQMLTVIKMDVSWLDKKLGKTNEAVNEKLHDLIEIIDATVQSVRRISYELRPQLLDLGLSAAIEWHLKEFEKRSGIRTTFNNPEENPELEDSVRTGLFRIFQESLTNIARHSGADHVHVNLFEKSKQLILSIVDNGKGFDNDKVAEKRTLGILGLLERCQMIGAHCDIQSSPGQGTTVTAVLPLAEKSEDYEEFNSR